MTHIPVLLNEVIKVLDPKPGEFIIDGTAGSGGHSAEILEKIGAKGKLLSIDWDSENIKNLETKFSGKKNIILVNENYASAAEILKKNDLDKADGLLIDLGFSSVQLESNRGFSFQKDEPLDMRYYVSENDPPAGGGKSRERIQAAAEIVNSYSEKELADIFYIYGEERMSRQIAKKIVEERRKERIMTTGRLVEVVKMAVGRGYEKGRINPATRVFQALRIYVNKELENLETVLKSLSEIIRPNGRVAIISFHSLEDRIVKNYFREMEKNKSGKILTKKPIIASEEEIRSNPRSRSAKLRAIIIM